MLKEIHLFQLCVGNENWLCSTISIDSLICTSYMFLNGQIEVQTNESLLFLTVSLKNHNEINIHQVLKLLHNTLEFTFQLIKITKAETMFFEMWGPILTIINKNWKFLGSGLEVRFSNSEVTELRPSYTYRDKSQLKVKEIILKMSNICSLILIFALMKETFCM